MEKLLPFHVHYCKVQFFLCFMIFWREVLQFWKVNSLWGLLNEWIDTFWDYIFNPWAFLFIFFVVFWFYVINLIIILIIYLILLIILLFLYIQLLYMNIHSLIFYPSHCFIFYEGYRSVSMHFIILFLTFRFRFLIVDSQVLDDQCSHELNF